MRQERKNNLKNQNLRNRTKLRNSYNKKSQVIFHKQSQTTQKDKQKSILPIIKVNGQQQSHTTKQQYNKSLNLKGKILKQSNLADKTKKINKKKINFQINYTNFHQNYKKYGKLFVHVLKTLTSNQIFQKSNQDQNYQNNFPPPIVNILYGQHIHNYNPYIQTLDRLYDGAKLNISKQKLQRIKKLCYIGIAKNYFKSQRYSETPNYGRVNILIRTYMYENMRNIVQQKAQNYQNIIYIPCNKGSLSFQYKKFPAQLTQICSPQFYRIVIQNVNKIIEGHYISYKKMNIKNKVTDQWGQNFIYFLTLLLIVIFLFTNSFQILYVIAFMIIILLCLYVYECRQTLSMLGSSKNIIQKIQDHIQEYLKQINVHNMEWKVGQDFYWLEIHYIRKKKKKVKNDPNQ